MRAIMRFSLIAVVVLGILAGLGFGGAAWYVMRKLGPDFWVALIEKDTNCRAHIDSAHISLFTTPATLKLENLRLAPRDAEVMKPFEERRPLTDAESPIVVPEVILEVKLDDLMNRRLNIQHLRFIRPVVRELQDEAGNSSLEPLFSDEAPPVAPGAFMPPPGQPLLPPGQLPGAYPEVPRAIPITQAAPVKAPPAPPSESSEDPSDFKVTVATASIEQGLLTLATKDSNTTVQNLNATVTGLDADPSVTARPLPIQMTLATEISVTGLARIGGVKRNAELAHLILSGNGELTDADPQIGVWNPATRLQLTLAAGSTLGGHVTMGDSAGKEMRKLQEYGIDLTPVPIGGQLMEDVVLNGIYADNQFTLTTPTHFVFPEYELMIEPNSWINSPQDRHELNLHLHCGPALQQRLQSGIAQAKLGDDIARAVTKALSDDRGRMTFDIKSSGSLSNPDVKPSVDRVLQNLLRGRGIEDLLKGLLRKL